MLQRDPSRAPAGYDDLFAGNGQMPSPPKIFTVTLDLSQGAWRFTITDPPVATNRQSRAEYRIYFCPISLANAAAVSNPNGAVAAFRQATMVASPGASNQGGSVVAESTRFFPQDGFFFATSVNLSYYETLFNGPVRSPVAASQAGLFVPPDISGQAIAKSHVTVLGQDVVKLDFTAKIPSDAGGVVSVGVTNGGTGYTSAPAVAFTSTDAGTGATASAVISSTGVVVQVIVSNPGSGYTVPPTVGFSGGGGAAAAATATVGPSTKFSGYQLYVEGYLGDTNVYESAHADKDASQRPGQPLGGTLYLLPDAHNTNFYFVAISDHGTRRADPTAAPVVNFAGGIT